MSGLEVCDDFELGPGDLLFLPQGAVHSARATEAEGSTHLTLGLAGTRAAVCDEQAPAGDLMAEFRRQLDEGDLGLCDISSTGCPPNTYSSSGYYAGKDCQDWPYLCGGGCDNGCDDSHSGCDDECDSCCTCTNCEDCPGGRYSSGSATGCAACPQGTYTFGGEDCTSCPAGYYGASSGLDANAGAFVALGAGRVCADWTEFAAYCPSDAGACRPEGYVWDGGYVATGIFTRVAGYWESWSSFERYCPDVSGGCGYGYDTDNALGLPASVSLEGCQDQCMEAGCDAIYWSQGHGCGNYFGGHLQGDDDSAGQVEYYEFSTTDAGDSLEACQDLCTSEQCDGIYFDADDSTGYGCGLYFGCAPSNGNAQGMDYYYWSHGCSECASGRYSSVDGATGCKSCPSGTYAEAGRSTCTTCAAGSYAGSGASNCTACPTGYVSTGETGAISLETACTLCEAGTYDAGTECVTCPAGTYSGDAATECTDCPAGRYSGHDGATGCAACPGGTYQDAAGATDCVDCAADNDDGEPGHYSTYSDGAASQGECVCETGWAGELCTVTSCSTVATISLGHMLLMANPLTRAYIGTTAAVDDTVTVTNDVRSALQEWDLDSNNILTYAEVTACLATYHVNVTNLDDTNNYVWSVPVPEPIVASTDDCDTADSLYTVSIVQATGAISDTDDFKIRAFGNNDVKLSYSCEVWDDDTGTASATFPTSYGLRKIFFLVKSDDVDDAAITITVSQPSGMSSTWDATLSQDDNDDYFSYTIETDQKEYYTNDDDDSTVLITSMVTSAMASLQMSQTYYWGGSTFIDSYAASFPSTSDSSDVCGASLDTPVDVTWAYTEDAYPDPDDDAGSIVYRQCGYLNGIEMDDDSFPSDYVDASTGRSYTISDGLSIAQIDTKRIYCIYTEYDGDGDDDADAALTSIICMVGLRVLGAPLDILPDMGNGAAGFNGVTLTWLDTYNSEGEFNVYRRSQGTSASSNTQVADVLVPSSKCGATVAPLTFTDTKTGYTPGARVVYTVVANPNWADQDTDMTNFTGTTVYTVPWLSLFTVSVVTSSGAGTPVPDVYVSVSHMLDSTTMDPSYDPVVYGYTDVNGDYSPLIRIVDETWSASKQYFNVTCSLVDPVLGPHVFNPSWQAVTSTHVYGGNANIKDETSVSVRGYLRSGGGTDSSNPDRNFDKYWGDCGDQILPSWEPEATAGQCYCALPSGQTIYMLRESGSTDSYSTDDLGYFEFAPMIGELVTVYFEGYAGSDNNTAIDFKVSTDVDDDDAVVQTKVAAPSITFTTDGDANVDFVTSTWMYITISLLGGAAGQEFITGQGFSVTADSCGFEKELVTYMGLDTVKVFPLESYTVTMYESEDLDGETLENCEDYSYDDIVSNDDDSVDVNPCRVPIPGFSGSDRLPCAVSEAGSSNNRIDQWFNDLYLNELTGVDMSNGDVQENFTYTAPICLSFVELLPLVSGELTPIEYESTDDERDATTEPYNNCGSTGACFSEYPDYNELLLLDAPAATISDDNEYGGPTCINSTSIFVKEEDNLVLSFKLVERYPGAVCAWPWQYSEYASVDGDDDDYQNTCGSDGAPVSLTDDNVYVEAAPTNGDGFDIDITLNDRISGLTTTISDEYDLTVDYTSMYDGFGYVYELTPAALNVFSPYTLQFSLAFSREFDGSEVDFDRVMAVLGTAPDNVPRLYAATTDPTLIFAVIRDPPGGTSSVSMEEGSTLGVSMSIAGLHAGAYGYAEELSAKMGINTEEKIMIAPLGIGTSTTGDKIELKAGIKGEQDSTVTTVTRENTKSFEFEFEFTTGISTSGDPFEAGQPSDLIVGGGANLRILSATQVYAYLSDKSEAATAYNDDPTEGPQYCVVTQNTYEWFPETVTTYVLSASQIEQQMTRLAKQKTDADCSDSTSWYASGNPSEDCDYVAEYASNDDTAQSRCQLTDDTGVNASSACPIACDTCPSTSLSAAELEEIQQAIDNWQTVLKNYRATSDRDEVATLQTHINSILSSISSTFTTFLSDSDTTSTFTDFLNTGQLYLESVRVVGGITPLYSYVQMLTQAEYLGAVLIDTKANCESGSLYGDETCDVYSKMQSSLEMVNNLLGICDDFDMVTLPSFTAFCSVPENNGDDLLPNYMLDTVGDGTRYITFGAGAEIEMEYAFTQTSTLEQVVGYAAEAEFSASLFAESKLNIVGAETEEEMALTTKGSVAVELGRSGEKSQARSHAVSISLGDEETGDVFAVKIETDTVYGTPIFTTIGGESTYGFEVQEGATSCEGQVPGDAIYFGIILQNTMEIDQVTADYPVNFNLQVDQVYAPWNAGKDYYDADNDGCGSDGYHLGLDITVMDGSGRGAGDLAQFANGIEFGQWEYILKIEHGPDTACDDYTGITISIYTSCAADSCTQYQEQLNDDGSITVLHPVWHNSTYCDGSDDEDCENNAWDEDYEPFGCYYSPSFSIPNFGWDRCSSELGLEDDDTWVASDSGDTCTQVGENKDSLCGVDGTSDADDFDDDEIVPAYDACVKACCDYVPALDTQTRRRRRRSLAALADDAKMRKWLRRDARAAPAAIRETSTTTIIHESRRDVVATAAAAVVLVASLAFVYVSQRKQTATLAKLEQRLDQILKLQGRDGAPRAASERRRAATREPDAPRAPTKSPTPPSRHRQYSPHWNITDPQSLATSERRGMLAYTRSRVLDIIAVAPYVLDGVHALFRSGTARAAPVDFERLRQSLYTHARAVETSSAYYVYAGLEDGTFAGYEVARGAVAYSLLHGGACPWNYSAACGGAADDPCAEGYPPAARCFRTYATDNHTGVPLCDPANATPASGATPQLRPQDGCWFDNHASDDAYDPRARPWYEAGGDAFDATGATTQFWSDPYLFSTGVVGVTAGRALVSSSDGAFVGVGAVDVSFDAIHAALAAYAIDEGALVFVTDAAGKLVEASDLFGAGPYEIMARDSSDPGGGGATAAAQVDDHPYMLLRVNVDDAFGFSWNATAVHNVYCPDGQGLDMDALKRGPAASPLLTVTPREKDARRCASCEPPTWSVGDALHCDSCTRDYFLDASGSCEKCHHVKGVEPCDAEGVTVETLALRSGYWRSSTDSLRTAACDFVDDCPGGRGGGDGLCAGESRGPKCALCGAGFVAAGSPDGESLGCEPCGGAEGWRREVLVLAAAAGLVLVLAAVALRRRAGREAAAAFLDHLDSHDGDPSALVEDDAEDAVEASSVAWLWNAVRPKIKCAIILFQLLGDMEFVLDVPFPPLYSKVWNALGKVVNIDLVEAVPLGCSFGWGFGTRLVVTTLWPLGAVAGVWLALGRRRETRGKATHASIAILYVVFPSASQLLFQSFVCENFDYPHSDAFARVLVLDYAVSCRSPRYHAIRFYAALFCAVYPAVPLFFFALLWRHRDRLNPYLDFAAFVDLATPTGGGGLKALAASDDAAARESRAFLRELDEAVPRAKQRVRDGFLEIAPYSLLYRECVLSSRRGAAIIVTLVYIVALARRVDMSDEPRFSREVYRGLLFLCGVVLPLALIALIVARVARRAAAEGDEVEARDAPAERDAPERPRSPLELEAAEREPPPGDDGDDGLYPETTIAFEDITFPEALANAPAMGINGFLCCAQA
ncbi:calcium ion binding protein [Aureococcus anophagefferens]|uniref:Calcium ion binding protein n=1 Tax=Aureococcus anophagefferens TaxID=44056 RepID=A0ABR1GCK4_AURAN